MSKNILLSILLIIMSLLIGFIAGRFFIPSEEIIIEETVIEWKDKIVYRDYPKMEYPELLKELKSYDTMEPTLKIYRMTPWSRH